MEAKIREVAPEVYQVYLPLPMRPSIVNVYLLTTRTTKVRRLEEDGHIRFIAREQ
jgi:hypothetical protein